MAIKIQQLHQVNGEKIMRLIQNFIPGKHICNRPNVLHQEKYQNTLSWIKSL